MRIIKETISITLLLSLLSLLAVSAQEASGAVPPLPHERMMEVATHVVEGKVIALSSKTQKSKVELDLLIARDRIFEITVRLSKIEKGKSIKSGEELSFEAWQPTARFPPLPGPQGHHPIPDKGDIVRIYLHYEKESKTYHPFMPNGIKTLTKAKKSK